MSVTTASGSNAHDVVTETPPVVTDADRSRSPAIAVGRLTFAFGLAIALAALAALRCDRYVLGSALVVATAPASPVAGVTLALARNWAMAGRRVVVGVLAALAVAPVGVFAVVFPPGRPASRLSAPAP